MKKVNLYLSLGSDLGEREENLLRAIELLDNVLGCRRIAVSRFYETEPWGFESETKFINAAVGYEVEIPDGVSEGTFGLEILHRCKDIERQMGRTDEPEYDASGKRIYHSRVIDIDILLLGDARIDLPELKVPHPLMNEREFVVKPLNEILRRPAGFPQNDENITWNDIV